jgi:phosphoglycolate phosphatase-like HAD superfamily hydrolase
MAAAGTWAFDVDGTLIGSIRSDRLRPGTTELLGALAARGVTCVLWSAGGDDYAARKAREHGIDHLVAACYSKDRRDADGRYVVEHFRSAHLPDVFVDDVPGDLPSAAAVVAVSQFFGSNTADGALVRVLDALDQHLGAPATVTT